MVGSIFSRSRSGWRTIGPPSTARTATTSILPPANSATCSASGNSISFRMYSVTICSGQIAWLTEKQSPSSRSGWRSNHVERMRAMRIGMLKTACPTLQATRFVSSLAVTAKSMSVSAAPASASTSGCAALPTTVRRSNWFCRSRRRSALVSTTVTSFFSETRLSATLAPTWPAPRMRIFNGEWASSG